MLAEIFDWSKIENVSLFYFWNKTRQNGQNFHFFKRPFLRNEWPYGYDFWLVFRDLYEASKTYNFAIFLKCQKLLKTQRPLTKKTDHVEAVKLHVSNRTLQEIFRMGLIKSAVFAVFEIFGNLVSMENFLNTNNCWRKQNFENFPTWPYLYFSCTFRIRIFSESFPYDRRSVSIVLQPSPFFPKLYLIFQFIIIKNDTNKKSVGKLVKKWTYWWSS